MPVKSFRIDDLLNYDYNRNDVINIISDSCKKNQSVSSECEPHNSDHRPSEPTDLTTCRKATDDDGTLNDGKSASLSFQSEEVPLPIYIRSDANFYGSWPPKRRIRTVFTVQQINQLEKKFQTQHYLSPSERIDVARHLNLTVLQVKTWFQNRRMKWKKSCNESPTP